MAAINKYTKQIQMSIILTQVFFVIILDSQETIITYDISSFARAELDFHNSLFPNIGVGRAESHVQHLTHDKSF